MAIRTVEKKVRNQAVPQDPFYRIGGRAYTVSPHGGGRFLTSAMPNAMQEEEADRAQFKAMAENPAAALLAKRQQIENAAIAQETALEGQFVPGMVQDKRALNALSMDLAKQEMGGGQQTPGQFPGIIDVNQQRLDAKITPPQGTPLPAPSRNRVSGAVDSILAGTKSKENTTSPLSFYTNPKDSRRNQEPSWLDKLLADWLDTGTR